MSELKINSLVGDEPYDLLNINLPDKIGDYILDKFAVGVFTQCDYKYRKFIYRNTKGRQIVLTQDWQTGRDWKIKVNVFDKPFKDLGNIKKSGFIKSFFFHKEHDTVQYFLHKLTEIAE